MLKKKNNVSYESLFYDDLRQYLANSGVKFSSQFTGKNKWDTSFGVAAMSCTGSYGISVI